MKTGCLLLSIFRFTVLGFLGATQPKLGIGVLNLQERLSRYITLFFMDMVMLLPEDLQHEQTVGGDAILHKDLLLPFNYLQSEELTSVQMAEPKLHVGGQHPSLVLTGRTFELPYHTGGPATSTIMLLKARQ